MTQQLKNRSDQWFYFADNDLLSARSLLKDGIWNQVCFHAHQAAEKAIKGYLKAHEIKAQKTHDLLELYETMAVSGNEWNNFYEGCVYLNRFYIATRYPDAFVGALPEGLPGEKDAIRALAEAENIVEMLKKVLGT
ncbi:MAG: HEPN domain-containing protein [bacterium]